MEETLNLTFRYVFKYLDACEIGNQGCKFLIQSDWNNFK